MHVTFKELELKSKRKEFMEIDKKKESCKYFCFCCRKLKSWVERKIVKSRESQV